MQLHSQVNVIMNRQPPLSKIMIVKLKNACIRSQTIRPHLCVKDVMHFEKHSDKVHREKLAVGSVAGCSSMRGCHSWIFPIEIAQAHLSRHTGIDSIQPPPTPPNGQIESNKSYLLKQSLTVCFERRKLWL